MSYDLLSVTATDTGLQAWKTLENPANHIDLVLTEVAMPGISGITLLSKIMSSDACKNIPVISEYFSWYLLIKQLLNILLSKSI